MEEIYQERGLNKEDVVILGVAAPNIGREGDVEHIKNFLKDKEINYPVVFDMDGETSGILMEKYQISSFPSTFLINKEGNIEGYIPGAIPKDFMEQIIDETLEK